MIIGDSEMKSVEKEMAPGKGANQTKTEITTHYNLSGILNTNEKTKFVKIPKSFFSDNRIDCFCKGLMGYLLSRPKDYEINPLQICAELDIGKDKIYSSLKNLINTGYCEKSELRNENGKFFGIEYKLKLEVTHA